MLPLVCYVTVYVDAAVDVCVDGYITVGVANYVCTEYDAGYINVDMYVGIVVDADALLLHR